jgi:hypothetical protein
MLSRQLDRRRIANIHSVKACGRHSEPPSRGHVADALRRPGFPRHARSDQYGFQPFAASPVCCDKDRSRPVGRMRRSSDWPPSDVGLRGQREHWVAVPPRTAKRPAEAGRWRRLYELSQLRCVTRSLREPDAFCLRRLAFFQDGLMRALPAMTNSYGLERSANLGSPGSVFSRPLR